MIILFGLAGSGKGTQGRALAEIFGWRWLSVGEVIRQTGEYRELTDSGKLIPDEDVINLMNRQIEKAEDEGFEVILDGYPRSATQAKYIVENMIDKINGAAMLDVPREELLKRLELRGRDDDKERASIERRFKAFEENIPPIVKMFEEAGVQVVHVDGVGKVGEVTDRLVDAVKRLDPEAIEQNEDVNGGEIERSYGE
ncbi:MAG: nucleoside monophosphate kinase [Candidatus Saccharibacteria bacterium]|nr:nucleoside monophosphate kinase [Candidatus Saccharibacteria bacterium]